MAAGGRRPREGAAARWVARRPSAVPPGAARPWTPPPGALWLWAPWPRAARLRMASPRASAGSAAWPRAHSTSRPASAPGGEPLRDRPPRCDTILCDGRRPAPRQRTRAELCFRLAGARAVAAGDRRPPGG